VRRPLFALVALLCTVPAFAEKKDVTVKADDGFSLKGSYYAAGRTGPGILMLHQCNGDRRLYDSLANLLSTAGYNVLAFDFRGFGDSRGGPFTDFASQRAKIVELMPADVDAAFKFLVAQENVNGSRLAVVGGSCGASQAIQAGRRHGEIRAMVLLSGGTDAAGETYIKTSKIAVLGAASEEDTDAAESIRKVVGASANPDSKLTMLKGAGHAASMFAKEPDLETDIVIWLRASFPVAGYSLR
jgi:dienelactone hydrolase